MRAEPRIYQIDEGLHSILGPSSAERWLECPGSVLASRGVKDVPSKYAIEGTAAHTVSEWVRKGVELSSLKGSRIRVKHADGYMDVPVNGEMMHSVGTFCELVAKQPGDELIEAMVHYEKYVKGGFGTTDSAKLQSRVCRNTDFKHGKGVKKDAKMNPQLMTYGVAIGLEYGWLYHYFDKYVLAISQPRLNHYDEWEISGKDLAQWAGDVLRPGAVRALAPNAPFKAGPWCKFCRIRDDCRVRAAYKSQEQGDGVSRSRGNDFGSLD